MVLFPCFQIIIRNLGLSATFLQVEEDIDITFLSLDESFLDHLYIEYRLLFSLLFGIIDHNAHF